MIWKEYLWVQTQVQTPSLLMVKELCTTVIMGSVLRMRVAPFGMFYTQRDEALCLLKYASIAC